MAVSATIAAVRISYGLWLDLDIRGAKYKQKLTTIYSTNNFCKNRSFFVCDLIFFILCTLPHCANSIFHLNSIKNKFYISSRPPREGEFGELVPL